MSCSASRVARAAAPMPVWNFERLWSAFLLSGFKVMFSGGVEDQNPNAAGLLQKYQISWVVDILVAKNTGERHAIAWHHNLWDLMLGASCGLEVSETVLTKWRNPEETGVMTSGSSKNVSNSGISIETVRMESRPCSKSTAAWSRNEYSSHSGSSGKW